MLDVVNVIEDEEVRTEQAEKSVVLSTSSTYRTPETPQGDNKSKFEQKTLSITKHSEDICLESSRNQVEGISENGIHLEEPSVHNVGLTYLPSST